VTKDVSYYVQIECSRYRKNKGRKKGRTIKPVPPKAKSQTLIRGFRRFSCPMCNTSFYKFRKLFTLKVSLYHTIYFDPYDNHHVLNICVDGNSCPSDFVVSSFSTWSHLCNCLSVTCIKIFY
jgi:hypothetical protein